MNMPPDVRMGMAAALAALVLAGAPRADEPAAGAAAVTVRIPSAAALAMPESLQRESLAAIERAQRWLLNQQHPDGHWSDPGFPALTALPVWALARAGLGETEAVRRAARYILSCAREDGSIFRPPTAERRGGGLPVYNTALCMVGLHALNDPAFNDMIVRARAYLAAAQYLGEDEYHGGMGYDPATGRPYADLSNSYIAYEAMRLTEQLREFERHAGQVADLDWEAARRFIASLQTDEGGFLYKPGYSPAGAQTNETSQVRFRSHGSITYAGMLSLIYANVDRDDPRVVSAFDWATRHWTLEENPGSGQDGLYYFYNVLAKTLAAYGQDVFKVRGEEEVNWRIEYTRRLLSLQKIDPRTGDGYWVNEAGRYLEADPVLVTSYSLLGLLFALGL